jgi:hypothetical protein
MKPLFGVAVFGLVPVPPMPARNALGGSSDDQPIAVKDLRKLPLKSHADGISDDVTKDEPTPRQLGDIDPELTADLQRR